MFIKGITLDDSTIHYLNKYHIIKLLKNDWNTEAFAYLSDGKAYKISIEDFIKLTNSDPIMTSKFSPYIPDINLFSPNKCEGCSYYESIKNNKITTPHIGDTPCTWCYKNIPMSLTAQVVEGSQALKINNKKEDL